MAQSKIGVTELRKHLENHSHTELVNEIVALFKELPAVRNRYEIRLSGGERILKDYKVRLYTCFYASPAEPNKAMPDLTSAQNVLYEFERLNPPPASLAQLKLHYVETGVEFINDFGDITDEFHMSIENTYQETLDLVEKSGLLDEFEKTCRRIRDLAQISGGTTSDQIDDIFSEHYAD